ncbi:MAG: TonB family protein [Terriglobales bacterium]
MDLRALLFTSDGSSAAALCRVLTEFGIQAEICSDMLVAAQQVARENYDAIIVDWDQEVEATFLLRTARQQKALGLNLALVPDDASIARALQQGANSVIKKPIDPEEARDTLGTARELILSRHTEQRDKEARHAAAQAETETANAPAFEEAQAAKPGFLSQSMSRSALEAEEKVGRPDTSGELRWQAARGPASLEEEEAGEKKEIQPVGKKRWDEAKSIFREDSEKEEAAEPAPARQTRDSTGVFSSLPEELQAPSEPEGSSPPRYLVFAMVACLLVAGALYIWAPGGSYLGRVSAAVHAFSAKSRAEFGQSNAPERAAQTAASEKRVAPAPAKASQDSLLDPGPVDSTDVDPSKIQIIETKAIPKPGAQQPLTVEPPPDSDQAKAQAQAQPQPEANAPTVAVADPSAVEPHPAAVAVPPTQPQPVAITPENSPSASDGRVGVIIPDSLRNTPAPSPASSLEPFMVPEQTSLDLLIHKVDPDYPAQALPQRLEGPVVLQAWIGKDGSVRDLKLVKGYFILGRAAIDAVKQWRFKPYTQNGTTSDFQTNITVNFKYPR